MNAAAWLGLAIMIGSEAATLNQVEPFWSWNTPIAWTGFIIFADNIVWASRRRSWLRSRPREFVALALASIPLWIVFEGYNLILVNWNYTGLPENRALRLFGYAWAFATIWPAIFEGADLWSVIRSRGSSADLSTIDAPRPASFSFAGLCAIAAGLLMLACPFLASASVARYLAAPVWLGFIFLLDPINARLGGDSLGRDIARGRWERVVNFGLSGVLCGVLWEFWNFWSRSKWHYTVPIMEHTKLFEMPVPGYLGFPAFALECFTMYVFVRTLTLTLVRMTTRN